MANYSNLKTAIENAVDWNNGDNEITGQNLLDILETIIDSLGAKYKFADVATPASSITTPDEPLFYLAGEGTYTNFSGLSVTIPRGTLAIFYYDTAWHYTTVRTDSDAFFNVNQYLGAPSTTYTKANGRNAVPSALRSKGMIITYLTTDGWIIEQNLSTSGTWNADANWQTIGPVSVSQNTLTIGENKVTGVYESYLTQGIDYAVTLEEDNTYLYKGEKYSSNYYALYKVSGSGIKFGRKYIFRNLPLNSTRGMDYISAYDVDGNLLGNFTYSGTINGTNNSIVFDASPLVYWDLSYFVLSLFKSTYTGVIDIAVENKQVDITPIGYVSKTPSLYSANKLIQPDGSFANATGYMLWKLLPEDKYATYQIKVKYSFGSTFPVIYAYDLEGNPICPIYEGIGSNVTKEISVFNYINNIKIGYFLICSYNGNTPPYIREFSDNSSSSFYDSLLFATINGNKGVDIESITAPTLYADGKFIEEDGSFTTYSGFHIWKLIPSPVPSLYRFSSFVSFGSKLPVVYAYATNDEPLAPMFEYQGTGTVTGEGFNYVNGIQVAYFLICSYGDNTQPSAWKYLDNTITKSFDAALSASSKCATNNAEIVNTIIVDINGGGDFTTLKSAFDSIVSPSVHNKYVVKILEGTYDAFEGYSVTEGSIGLVVPNYTTLEGIGDKRNIIIKGELSDSASTATKTSNSTLNVEQNCTLRNLTITGKNVRYCVHSDRQQGENTDVVIENCNFYHYGNSGNAGYSSTCWGMGTWTNCRRIFRNCEFNSENDASWATHDRNSGTDKPCYILLENCRFINRNATLSDGEAKFCSFMIQSIGDDNNSVVEVVGCSGNLPLLLRPAFWGGGTDIGCDYQIIGDGNNFPIHFADDYRANTSSLNRGNITTLFGNEGCLMKNDTGSTITLGTPCKLTNNGTVAVATSNDDFWGIANQDIPDGEFGYVKNGGYFDIADLSNVSSAIGTKIGIVNGALADVQSGELFIVKYYGYIKL